MADVLDEVVTPSEVDVEETTGEVTPDPASETDKPYLVVNDRIQYKTSEDAIKGFNEASTRIASLTPWAKLAEEYGNLTPEVTRELFNELLALRKSALENKGKGEEGKGQPSTVAAPKPGDPKDEAALKWLREKGYISKSEMDDVLKTLKAEIETLKSGSEASQGEQYESRIETAEATATKWLIDLGYEKSDAEGRLRNVVGPLVKDWINQDPSRIKDWNRGGASMERVTREGFDLAMKYLEWKAPAKPAPVSATLAANKGKQLQSNKKLPAADGSGTKQRQEATKSRKSQQETDDEAWEEFQKALTK